jgi:hypothetical protein
MLKRFRDLWTGLFPPRRLLYKAIEDLNFLEGLLLNLF